MHDEKQTMTANIRSKYMWNGRYKIDNILNMQNGSKNTQNKILPVTPLSK